MAPIINPPSAKPRPCRGKEDVMKSDLIGPKNDKPKRPKYPYLGIFPNGEVVLFESPYAGYSVHHPKGCRLHYSDNWDEDDAEPLKGKIVLRND